MKRTILVLDQDYNFLNIYNYILPKENFYLLKCKDIVNAIGFLESIKIGAIICDVDKPRGCGIEMLKLLKKRGERIPVIIVSGSFYPSDIMISEEAFAFIPKVQLSDVLPKLLSPESAIWEFSKNKTTV